MTSGPIRALAPAAVLLALLLATGGAVAQENAETALVRPAVRSIALPAVEASAAALLLSGETGGDVAGAMVWAPGRWQEGADRRPVVVVVEVDREQLLGESSSKRIPVELYGYAVSGGERVVAHLAEGVILAGGKGPLGVRFVAVLDLPPGRQSLRVIVRNRATGRFFLGGRELETEASGGLKPYMAPPLVVDGTGGQAWLDVRASGASALNALELLVGADGWPAAHPLWRADKPLEVSLVTTGQSGGSSPAVRLTDRLGQTVLEPEVLKVQRVAEFTGVVVFRLTLAPPDLRPEEYRLEVAPAGEDAGGRETPWVPVRVVGPGSNAATWPDRGSRVERAGALTSPPRSQQGSWKELRQRYLEALRGYAEGRATEARRMVAEVERGTADASSPRPRTKIQRLEVRSVRRAAREHPAALLAAALLHRDLFRWYLARGEPVPAGHAWAVAAELAEVAGKVRRWEPPERFVSGFLLSLADDLARAGSARSARLLLHRVLAMDRTNEKALLGMALLEERSGNSVEALAWLERLCSAHPDNAGGQLRRAVNARRTGLRSAAEAGLRRCAQSGPPWARTVAYQELIRLLADRHRLAAADEVSARAVARFPGNQQLRVLRAWVLDLLRRPEEACAIVDRLKPSGHDSEPSPRLRYAAWPALAGAPVRDVLAAARQEGRAALLEALQ